jgi:peptide chain release factor 2
MRNSGGMFDLSGMKNRVEELTKIMESPDFWNDQDQAAKLNREQKKTLSKINKWKNLEEEIDDAEVMLELAEEEKDEDSLAEAEQMIEDLKPKLANMKLEQMLSGPYDDSDCFLSINAGAGGTEAQDWTDILARMYLRYSERREYEVEIIDAQPGEEAGVKSITLAVKGEYAYGYLRAEKGVHRLVRISPFDANSRRHTSFAAVFVLPDIESDIEIDINPDDIRIDTYRASGCGGQKVNKTSSAVRITHDPTGIVVQCQNERSQHKNKAQAMKVLKARLYELEEQKQREKLEKFSADKKDIEWGSQIRSYVMQPYQMVKDIRTSHETGNVQAVLDGDIHSFIESYLMQSAKKGAEISNSQDKGGQ